MITLSDPLSYIVPFTKELKFEDALTKLLTKHGWGKCEILHNPSEKDLISNWASIIYQNNREIDRLGDFPLTETEMDQIINQVNLAGTPYKKNQLLLGQYVTVKRDNPNDLVNKGKTVYLQIFDPQEISTGKSVYQIVRQPRFKTTNHLASERRGDVMLLINGIPMIHIELKRSGVDVTQAVNQIRRYTTEGVFSMGIFSLVQIFVAMTPEKTLYFANPGAKQNFNAAFQFHWADSNNKEAKDWQYITANLLSIPMAHQLIGYYTIADDKDETLKVLRSYQYYATNAICDRVHHTNWDNHAHKGGFVWHTTGSGKTMTSFKAAQLIAKANDADKVVFLLDRIELSTQSADEYRGFANADDNVLDTENTASLVSSLESNDKDVCLIVTSLQKMARVNTKNGVPQSVLDIIGKKRIVFIVDECHRGADGEMLMGIKKTFPRALIFGFTGTPVFPENAHGEITTEVIFGDMLHKYTLADGIPDKNVLGFDLYKEETFKEEEIRREVALKACEVKSEDEIGEEGELRKRFNEVMFDTDMIKIEEKAKSLYDSDEHHKAVMLKIMEDFPIISRNGTFHAMLATRNIPEAIRYYKLFKEHYPDFNVAAIFDDSIDNVDKIEYKEEAILEMLDDYNRKFGTKFMQSTYAKYKKDVAKRLAHKAPYKKLPKNKQINLLIVVTQMLTGYDSKYVNVLYVDKLLRYVDVVQAFSRTNRLYGPEKPFGIIKYFYRPNMMEKNIEDALELYVDQPLSVFTDKLEANLEKINSIFKTIEALFNAEGIKDFASLPKSEISRKKFAKEFCEMNRLIGASRMQGFDWDKKTYDFEHTNGYTEITVELDEETYKVLLQRYRELFERVPGDLGDPDIYQLESYIIESAAGTIDADYINSRFVRYVKYLYTDGPDSEKVKSLLQDLHHSFANLSQRDQRTALTIIHDIQRGNLRLSPEKTILDYIKEYQKKEVDHQVYALSEITGLNAKALTEIINAEPTTENLDERNRFTNLMRTFDGSLKANFVKKILGRDVKPMFLGARVSEIIKRFILNPSDRAKILFAYNNDDFFLDQNITDSTIEEENKEAEKKSEEEAKRQQENNRLSDEEKRTNIANLVRSNLRGLRGWPGTDQTVEAFFKIINIPTASAHNGIAIDFYKVFDEIFARREANFIDKHVGLSTLLIRFEVFLKKVYFLLNDKEIPQQTGSEKKVSLAESIKAFDCLWGLRSMPGEKYRKLSSYLSNLREWRNTEGGNGAHSSVFMPDEELDRRIKEVVTLYMYVTGSCLQSLKEKRPELN